MNLDMFEDVDYFSFEEALENGCEFVFTIITKPEVNVKSYTGLKVEKVNIFVEGVRVID